MALAVGYRACVLDFTTTAYEGGCCGERWVWFMIVVSSWRN